MITVMILTGLTAVLLNSITVPNGVGGFEDSGGVRASSSSAAA